MTKHLTSSLSDVLYIFDEPSIGQRILLASIEFSMGLKKKGNTVVLVDHDPDIIKTADHIEYAGANGGRIILISDTLTGKALSKKHTVNTDKMAFPSLYT
ncbi:hypothetical protein [Lysinibacillus sphaericus]|uniref:hypothetical protein n=1 Tax=Lysinibacillus sphaericus TaxID=1421 RepID=UPI001C8EC3B3|nr:hypothetical protein [Lysinibacillus sp. SDF0037]